MPRLFAPYCSHHTALAYCFHRLPLGLPYSFPHHRPCPASNGDFIFSLGAQFSVKGSTIWPVRWGKRGSEGDPVGKSRRLEIGEAQKHCRLEGEQADREN